VVDSAKGPGGKSVRRVAASVVESARRDTYLPRNLDVDITITLN
jgi:tRNA nucleotidyltransferase (CCA-adding enzyme)